MLTVFQSLSVRWRAMRRRRRAHRDTMLMLHQFSDHMLRDIGLHEPRSIDDPRFWSDDPLPDEIGQAADKNQAPRPSPDCNRSSSTNMRRDTPRPAIRGIFRHQTHQART